LILGGYKSNKKLRSASYGVHVRVAVILRLKIKRNIKIRMTSSIMEASRQTVIFDQFDDD